MEDLAFKIRAVYDFLSRKEKGFLGGPPFASEINRELQNYILYSAGKINSRPRIRVGMVMFSDNDEVVSGYQSTTILNNALPTAYEREYIHLKDKLNYVQCKLIFVHPDYRRTGCADDLLQSSILIAKREKKDWLCDTVAENSQMIALLSRNKIIPRYEWFSRNKTKMLRFGFNS